MGGLESELNLLGGVTSNRAGRRDGAWRVGYTYLERWTSVGLVERMGAVGWARDT